MKMGNTIAMAAAAALFAGGLAPGPAAAEIVARVGGAEIPADELRAYVETLGSAEQAALAKDPSMLSQVVRSYLARRAVLTEAQSKKWEQRPEVKSRLDRLRDQALIELYLQSVSIPPDGFPAEAQVRAAYDANLKAFEVPRQVRVAQIFIAVAAGADKDAEEKARKRIDEVSKKLRQKGTDFAALARAESDDKATVERGGDIGWLAEGQIVAGIRSAVLGLAKDSVSEPIRLDDGWHVVKVLETKSASTRPFAEVKESIAAQLRSERAQANRQAYLSKLLEQNPPAINELALSKLLPKQK